MSNIVKWTSRALDWMSPRAATIEQLGHPAAGVIGWLGGNASASGIAVTEENAYDYSPVFAATRLLASGAGNLPCRLMLGGRDKQQRKGGRKVAVEHPVHKLVYDAPNPLMTSASFRNMGVVQQVNAGNFYAEIERDGAGRPLKLWPIHCSRVRVVRQGESLTYYVYAEGRTDALTPSEMLHVHSPICIDGISGMGVIAHARETIGAGMQAEKHAGYTFANGAVPRTVLSHPRNMSKDARQNLREEWQQLYGGTDNAGKTAVLWEGMTLTPLSINNDDAQFLETRGFNVTEVARWYGVPPHMIGDMSGSTNNNIEHQGRSFIQLSLMPIIIPWEEEFDRKLLTQEERDEGYYIYFDVNEWQRGDKQARAMSNQIEFMNGFINQDEVRESEDKDPLPNGWGQKFYIPANLMEVGAPKPEVEPVMPVSEGAPGGNKPRVAKAGEFNEDDHPRDEGGRFAETDGGGAGSKADRRRAEDEERKKELVRVYDERRQRLDREGRERFASHKEELDRLEEKRAAEDAANGKPSPEVRRERKAEDRAIAKRHEAEEDAADDRMLAEGRAIRERSRIDDAAVQNARDLEDGVISQEEFDSRQIEVVRDAEDVSIQERRDRENYLIEHRRGEEEEEVKERHRAEDKALNADRAQLNQEIRDTKDRRKAEDAQIRQARKAEGKPTPQMREAREAEDEARAAKREAENEAFDARKEALDDLKYRREHIHRDENGKIVDSLRQQEWNAIMESERAEDAALKGKRDAEDKAIEDRRKREDEERKSRKSRVTDSAAQSHFKLASEAASTCLTDAFVRLIRVEQNAARAASKKPGKWLAWLDEFYGRHEGQLRAALEPPAKVLLSLGKPCDVESICKAHCKESYSKLLAASDAQPEAFEAAVETLVAGWTERATIKEESHV